jgi:hopene-associated glycosyltransferase HpnB
MLPVLCVLVASSAILWIALFLRIQQMDRSIASLDSAPALPEPAGGWPFLSVIVPARNEEKDVAACLESLLNQDYPSFELIFIDDQSADRTAAIARRVFEGHPHARVIAGADRPAADWVGKSWALVQGGAQARGDWLLFIDSDVVHHRRAFRQAAATALELGVDALSIMPTINCRSFWEKCVMPLFALLCALVEPFDRTNHPEKSASRLSGAFILIRRSAYDAAGGHASVHDQVLEDMALAENLKKQGRPLWLTYTHDLTSTRMYDSFHDLWAGLSRLGFPMLGYSYAGLAVAALATLVGALTPPLAATAGVALLSAGSAAGPFLAPAGAALLLLNRFAVERVFRVVKIPSSYAWLLPLAATLYCLAAMRGAFRHATGRGLSWKQRVYHASPG